MDPGDAAVVAGAIAGAVALLGTIGGAFTGRWASREQAREQGRIQHRQWLRDHQRIAYADLHAIAVDTVELAGTFAQASGPAAADAGKNLTASLYKLVRAGATVGIVGPDKMKRLAAGLVGNAYKTPGSPDAEPTWELWAAALNVKLTEFSTEANKIISETPGSETVPAAD
ncbi:hypothetical protein OG851_42840 (plasmid) [Streptomyces sp. NBC_00161]|uniref:hypothetical protein n=1 Tax=Streptomyces sp. NBC_00161 TaxID=2975671 RepID=UPI002F919C76